jgi:hypothetical protein
MMELGIGLDLNHPGQVMASSVLGGPALAVSSYPTVSNSRLWLDRNFGVYSDTAGTTAAAINDGVASWRAVGSGWGTDLVVQATASRRPILKSEGIQGDGIDDRMDLPSTISITGAFTCYLVAEAMAASPISIALGGNQGTWGPPMNYRFSDGSLYAYDQNAGGVISKAYNTTSGLRLIRLRRNASNAMFYAATGLAEGASFGSLAYSYTLAYIMASIGSSSIFSTSSMRFRQIVLVAGDAVTDGGDTDIRTKLLALEGVDL